MKNLRFFTLVIAVMPMLALALLGVSCEKATPPPGGDTNGIQPNGSGGSATAPKAAGEVKTLVTVELTGNTSCNIIALSPDQSLLAGLVSSDENLVKVWSIPDGKEKHSLKGHTDLLRSIDFTPDGKTLVSIDNGGGTIEWDMATGKQMRSFKLDAFGSVGLLAVSSDVTTIVTITSRVIVLWDYKTGKELARLLGHKGFIDNLTWTPDSKHLVSTDEDKTLRYWDVANKKELWKVEGVNGYVTLSPDGKTIATPNGGLQLWNIDDGSLLKKIDDGDDLGSVAAFSTDGKQIAIGGYTAVTLWDIATGKQLKKWPYAKDYDPVSGMHYLKDGSIVATTGKRIFICK
jgi:WD40 repeat protein